MKSYIYILTVILFLIKLPHSYAESSQYIVIDVRTPQEYSDSHIKGSQNIDFLNLEFQQNIEKLDKSKTYKLYCRSGNRSGKAQKLMQSLGFQNVENLGSLGQAAKALKLSCEGKDPC